MSGSSVPAPRFVELVTRTGCHLCDEAAATLTRLAPELGFSWQALDVDADPDRQDLYGDRVPVVLIDGREHGYWRIEEDRFRQAVSRSAAPWRPAGSGGRTAVQQPATDL